MKVAIVLDLYNDINNGTTKSARHLVAELIKQNIEVNILCRGKSTYRDGNIFYFKTKHFYGFQKACEKQNALLAQPNDELIIEALEGVDIVHNFLPFWLGTRTAKLAKKRNIPVLSCLHVPAECMTMNCALKYVPYADNLLYYALKKLHFKDNLINDIYCPSQCIADRVLECDYKQNLHIISNGYNDNFKMINNVKKPQKYKNKFIISSVGRLSKEKNQDIIIKAIAKSRYKKDIVLLLAGNGQLGDNYKSLAKKYGVNLEIEFMNVDELVKMHNYSDIYIHASAVETESLATLEAVACGNVPIISNAKMNAAKQFALNDNSLFDLSDIDDLTKKIEYWYENKDTLYNMKKVYADSAKKYSLENSVKSMIRVYLFMIINKEVQRGKIINYNSLLAQQAG